MAKKINLTPAGKLFFTSVLNSITTGNMKSMFRIKGEPEKLRALSKAIQATKEYYDELKNPNSTVESVMKKLQKKHEVAQEFKDITGKDWPL
jgi:uncharacterized membrane protein (DUF106 family)